MWPRALGRGLPCLQAGDAPKRPHLCLACRDPRVSRPQGLLLSLVLKRIGQAPVFTGPAGAVGETGWHPTCPAPLSVLTALRAAAVLSVSQCGPPASCPSSEIKQLVLLPPGSCPELSEQSKWKVDGDLPKGR